MKEQIKPCPFCGEKAEIESWSPSDGYQRNDWYWKISCNQCNLEMIEVQKEDVIRQWNTRAKQENNPLTLDEVMSLKENDVVWIKDTCGIHAIQFAGTDRDYFAFFSFGNELTFYQFLVRLNKDVFIYRNKPEEEQK